jgi:hypothetical protein
MMIHYSNFLLHCVSLKVHIHVLHVLTKTSAQEEKSFVYHDLCFNLSLTLHVLSYYEKQQI